MLNKATSFDLSPVLSVALIIVVSLLSRRKGRKKVVIPDFRRGVTAGGASLRLLEPGTHIYDPRKGEVALIDMRPQPVLAERLPFRDALQNNGVISVGASLVVRDPLLSATALRDQVKDGVVIIRASLKKAMANQIVAHGASGPEADLVRDALLAAINDDLAKVGMGLSEIEITELWVRAPKPLTTLQTDVVQ